MSKPFKFRYTNEIVGSFVLLVVVVLVVGIIMAGRAQGWFETWTTIKIRFPPAGTEGIQESAEVRVLGTLAGSVKEIVVDPDNSIGAVLKVRGKFMRFICADSEAILKRKFVVAGDAYIEVTRGHGAELPDGSYIPCRKDTEIIQMLTDTVQKIRETIVPLMDQARQTVKEYGGLAEDLRKPDAPVQQMLSRLNQITINLQEGKGALGKLLSDPETAAEVQKAIVLINASLVKINSILVDVKNVSPNLPELNMQTQSLMAEAQKLVEGMQKSWLIRSYIEQAPKSPLISPAQVQGPMQLKNGSQNEK